MNYLTRIIRRFAVLPMLLTVVGLGASAQEALPLRAPAVQTADVRVSPTPDLTAPDDMAQMLTFTVFSWLDTGAPKYKLMFTDMASGDKHKLIVQSSSCNTVTCSVTPYQVGLFATLKDGMTLTWRVAAMMPDGPVKSAVRTVTVNEVEVPSLVGPGNGEGLSYNTELAWSNANAINDYVRIVMVDTLTGKKALNQYYDASACGATCSLMPRHFTGKLVVGRTYTWFIKAFGFSGETAKSETRTVVVQ